MSTRAHARQSDNLPVRERSANTIGPTVGATPDRHQRVDCMELQHGAGTSHCSCDAASSESRPRYGPDGRWRTGVPGPSAEQLIRYLRCNGVAAELMRVELDGRSTGEVILASAQSLGCDLLIKGAYTQSRLRQMIFGGATQHVLANAGLPVLLAN